MKYIISLFFLLKEIISQEEQLYVSPCEKNTDPKQPEDCYGKSCEFIEETCCYLESIVKNETTFTNESKYECVDFAISDYDRPEQKELAIQQIKNGTYWITFNETYEEILVLKCNCNYSFPYMVFLILLFWGIIF